jgi:hypothetical protein
VGSILNLHKEKTILLPWLVILLASCIVGSFACWKRFKKEETNQQVINMLLWIFLGAICWGIILSELPIPFTL